MDSTICNSNNNLESVLISVNQFININKDRKTYMDSFRTLRDKLFEILKKDSPFSNLFNGLQLGGSYGDNSKINKPDEFDLVFHLKLPENKILKVKKDPEIPGNIILDLTNILEKIKNEKQHIITYEYLRKWITVRNELLVDNLQHWLENCFKKALTQLQNKLIVDNKESSLIYKRCGPAHTIYVYGDLKYSVDFVPGILLEETHCIINNNKGRWEAIPKPMKPPQPNMTSFRASFYTRENELMKDNRNLKNALRIIKKFRDSHPNINNLKSYYIKTLFLWKISKCGTEYWKNALSIIVVDMFKELEESLYEKKLPFYWNNKLNMYDKLNNNQLKAMHTCVKSYLDVIMKASNDLTPTIRNQVYRIFLNKAEMDTIGISNPTTMLTSTSINIINNQKSVKKEESEKGSDGTSNPTFVTTKVGFEQGAFKITRKQKIFQNSCNCQPAVKPKMISVGTNTDFDDDINKCKIS